MASTPVQGSQGRLDRAAARKCLGGVYCSLTPCYSSIAAMSWRRASLLRTLAVLFLLPLLTSMGQWNAKAAPLEASTLWRRAGDRLVLRSCGAAAAAAAGEACGSSPTSASLLSVQMPLVPRCSWHHLGAQPVCRVVKPTAAPPILSCYRAGCKCRHGPETLMASFAAGYFGGVGLQRRTSRAGGGRRGRTRREGWLLQTKGASFALPEGDAGSAVGPPPTRPILHPRPCWCRASLAGGCFTTISRPGTPRPTWQKETLRSRCGSTGARAAAASLACFSRCMFFCLPRLPGLPPSHCAATGRWRNQEPDPGSPVSVHNPVAAQNGPYTISANLTAVPNPNTWAAFANMLYLDQPIWTGLSYSNSSQDGSFTMLDVGNTVLGFLQSFFKGRAGWWEGEIGRAHV